VKYNVVILGMTVLGFSAPAALGRFEQVSLTKSGEPFAAVPLVQWDEFETLAQQQTVPPPVVVTPPAATTPPVTPPATVPAAPVTIAPATPPPVPPATDSAAPPPAAGDTPEVTDPAAGPATDGAGEEDFSMGDIPIVETIELTTEKAKKALDTYILVREKYKDAALENYENLQDFVDQSPQGKAFEADVKAAGFPNVIEWNTTITTLSFAYDNSVDDQTLSIKQQIEELNADTETAQDMRERMIKALQAMIPSDNNKKVLEEVKADPAYVEELKMLGTETE
jgi:hypothetical protein